MVYGEQPYAEFEGDRETLALPESDHVRAILRRLQSQHIPAVSVLLSGRPLWVNPELNLSDAFVAAWLPGSEGEGVADLLFRAPAGASARNFTGRLSFPWPATAMPVTYDAQGHVAGALFASRLRAGPGTSGVFAAFAGRSSDSPMWHTKDSFYDFGHVIAPWSIYVSDDTAQVRLTRSTQSSPAGAVQAIRLDGAIRADWSGNGHGVWWIGDKQTDLSAKASAGMALSVTYQSIKAPSERMLLGMQCGVGCAGWLDVTESLRAASPANWQTMQVPLRCFASHGADLRDVSVPFALATSGRAAISIRRISLVPGRIAEKCPGG